MTEVADVLLSVRQHLLHLSAVRTLLGPDGSGVFVALVPSKTPRPYVVLHQLDQPGEHHLGGASSTRKTIVQVEAWSATSEGASALARAIEVAIDGWRGTMGSVWCLGAFKKAHRGPAAESLGDGGQAPAWSVQMDVEFWTDAA